VAPKGVEEYPKYVIEFSSVYAFSCEEEAGSISYAGALKEQRSEELGCSYIWQDSPQAITYGTFVPDMAFHGGNGPVRHYVILGGDYNVGIVAADFPTIRVIENGETITLKYKV